MTSETQAKNERQKAAFAAWQGAQAAADRAKRVWGVTSPHRAADAQAVATEMMNHWRRA